MFSRQGISFDAAFQVFFRAFKMEKVLELWVSGTPGHPFRLLKSYEVCAASGVPGPKRCEGDRQVPEGVYHINRFNPKSHFYLSLGLDYPTVADLKFADPSNPGGDIFIHGGCTSTGCLAMTDDAMKEIYTVAGRAENRNQSKIQVHIFPAKMTDENLKRLVAGQPEWAAFWEGLRVAYDFFEKARTLMQ